MDSFPLKFLKYKMWLCYLGTYSHIKSIAINARTVFFLQVISMLLTIKSRQQVDLIANQYGKSKWVWFFNYF